MKINITNFRTVLSSSSGENERERKVMKVTRDEVEEGGTEVEKREKSEEEIEGERD